MPELCQIVIFPHGTVVVNRRGTVLRIAFSPMEPSGTVVEPSRNRPVSFVFPLKKHVPGALIILLLKDTGPGTVVLPRGRGL